MIMHETGIKGFSGALYLGMLCISRATPPVPITCVPVLALPSDWGRGTKQWKVK